MIGQLELIHGYNSKFRPPFNKELFARNSDEVVEAIRKVVYSIQRNSSFTIRVEGFEVITGYDEIRHILWEYDDKAYNKGKKSDTSDEDIAKAQETAKKKSSSSGKKKVNLYEFINLSDSDVFLIKINYFIAINEKKDGYVEDRLVTYIAIPRIVDKYYYRINGTMYSAMYQIVDASTYNNSASKNKKKQSITFKTVFTPIRVYRYISSLKDINNHKIPCVFLLMNVFKKSVLIMKYLLARYGFFETLSFLNITGVNVVQSIDLIDRDNTYIFPIRDMYVVAPKFTYDNNQAVQSLVYTLYDIINKTKDITYGDLFNINTYVKSLGADFVFKDMDTSHAKGMAILESLESSYDEITKNDLKLSMEDKADIYRVLRWMIYEFNALRRKDNLDITTKKVRYAEYIASIYAAKLVVGIYRISDKGDKATLATIRKAINVPPMFLLSALANSETVNYNNSVNDLDAIIPLKYTYKGIAGIGDKASAIPKAYKMIHPSHLGRVDIDSSSNSDPGISGGILCPYVNLYDGHFSEYTEPSTWREDMAKLVDAYKATDSRVVMCRIINDAKVTKEPIDSSVQEQCASINGALFAMANNSIYDDGLIHGFDIFGDELMIYEYE